jgi:flagellar hook-associated protein 2
MATISSAGIGSGLDVNGIVSKLMTVEQQPLTKLDTKEAGLQAKLSAYGSLKGAFASVQSAALALKSPTLFGSMAATSSNSSVIAASANTAAQAGSYTLKVIAKAQPASISSQALPDLTTDLASDANADSIADAGKLTIELGTYTAQVGIFGNPGYVPASFTTNPDKAPVTIDINAGSSSLSDIRDAINAANAGVKANLVYVGSAGYKLTITSNDTGATNSVKLTAMDADSNVLTDNTGLARLSFDPLKATGTGKEFSVNSIAQDANFTIDGLALTRSTNSVSDAITGVTLSIGNVLDTETTLTISKDTAAAQSAIANFVKSYNDLNTQLHNLTAYNADTKQSSVLTGDSGARGLQAALRAMITYRQTGSSGVAHSLSDLGVAMQRDGSLLFNATKLATVQSSTTDLSALFTSTSTSAPGLAVRMSSTLDGILATSGLIATQTDGINRSVKDIGSQRIKFNSRLTQIEARYRKQFSALDSLVASMQATSQYLTQQLANLPSTSK